MTYGRRQDLLGEWTMDRPNAKRHRSGPSTLGTANDLGRHRVLVNSDRNDSLTGGRPACDMGRRGFYRPGVLLEELSMLLSPTVLLRQVTVLVVEDEDVLRRYICRGMEDEI